LFPAFDSGEDGGIGGPDQGLGSAFVSAMTAEQLDAALDALREMLAARASEAANVIEGTA
jgi:hypothetical protein